VDGTGTVLNGGVREVALRFTMKHLNFSCLTRKKG